MPKASVIVPAFNESASIAKTLTSLLAQDFKDFDVHIVDDASTDNTAAIVAGFAARHPEKIFLHQPGKKGAGGARNYAAHLVNSKYLAFLDGDSAPVSNWLSELIETLEKHPDFVACGGPNRAPRGASEFQIAYEEFYLLVSKYFVGRPFGFEKIVEVPHNPSRNVCYRADIFKSSGGFREDLFPGEDMALDLELRRQGYRFLFNPKAMVEHEGPKDFTEFRKTVFGFGKIQAELLRAHGFERKIQVMGVLFWIVVAATFFLAPMYFLLFVWKPQTPRLSSFCVHMSAWFLGFLRGLLAPKTSR